MAGYAHLGEGDLRLERKDVTLSADACTCGARWGPSPSDLGGPAVQNASPCPASDRTAQLAAVTYKAPLCNRRVGRGAAPFKTGHLGDR
jgi:hypothetical protein